MVSEDYTPETENEEGRKNRIKWTPELISCLVLLFALIVLWFFKKTPFPSFKEKTKKKDFIAQYQVDKKTFNNWVKYYGGDVFPDYDAYLKVRKFTLAEVIALSAVFGVEEEGEPKKTKNKKEITEECESDYRTLRECVKMYPTKFGISPEAYANTSIFPPRIAELIIKQFK